VSDYIIEKNIADTKEEILEKHPMLACKDLFDMVTRRELDKVIVGEVEARQCIFLCAMGMFVENATTSSYNLLVNDVAGAGKDYICGKTLGILPKKRYHKRTRISPTAFTYWHNAKYEPHWTWDGKVLYLEDIQNAVLNSPVFKVMCSSGSHATIVKDQRAIDIEIKGKPVMVITSATAAPNPELTRRFTILNLDSGIDQTKAIIDRHCNAAINGEVPEILPEFTEMFWGLTKVKVKIPFADKLAKHIPPRSVIMRTHILRFLDYIKASAAFHQWQRKYTEDGFILATGQDYEIARTVMQKTTSNNFMIPLTKDQRRIMEFFAEEQNQNLWFTVQELEPKITWMSDRWLRKQLDRLVEYGLLNKDLEDDERKKHIIYGFMSSERIELPERLEGVN
jgi:hypothetical protein